MKIRDKISETYKNICVFLYKNWVTDPVDFVLDIILLSVLFSLPLILVYIFISHFVYILVNYPTEFLTFALPAFVIILIPTLIIRSMISKGRKQVNEEINVSHSNKYLG